MDLHHVIRAEHVVLITSLKSTWVKPLSPCFVRHLRPKKFQIGPNGNGTYPIWNRAKSTPSPCPAWNRQSEGMRLRNSHLFWPKNHRKNKTFWKHPILTVRIIPSLTVVWCFPWTCFQSFLNWAEECLTEPPGWFCLRKLQRIQSSSENMITHAHLMRRRSNTKGLTPLLRNLEIWRSSPHSSPKSRAHKSKQCEIEHQLVVSTHLKNISQNWNLPQIGVKIKNIWNHYLEQYSLLLFFVVQADSTNLGAPIWYTNLGTLCWSPQPFSQTSSPEKPLLHHPEVTRCDIGGWPCSFRRGDKGNLKGLPRSVYM